MIITKTPVRVPLGGGGTDLPFYYSSYGGFVLAATVKKYIYIVVNDRFDEELRISYSKTEITDNIEKIQHPIVRETLRLLGLSKNLEIVSISDVPSNSGLGSSGSFTVGLLNALHTYRKDDFTRKALAEQACKIEMDILGEPVGKQDQYASAYGGFVSLQIDTRGNVDASVLQVDRYVREELENSLVYFFSGIKRDASEVLSHQKSSSDNNGHAIESLHRIKGIGSEIKKALEQGHLKIFGELLHEHWLAKRGTSKMISNDRIDAYYDFAIKNGATGGKIMGAGGGGFFMFYCAEQEDKRNLRKAFASIGLREITMEFEQNGTRPTFNAM